MSRSEEYQIRCTGGCEILIGSHKLKLKEYNTLKNQLGEKPYIEGAIDWAFEDAYDVVEQNLKKIVDRYYDTNLNFDLSIMYELESEFCDTPGRPGVLIVIVNFDGLDDDESSECSSDEITRNVIDDITTYLNEFLYTTNYEGDNINSEDFEPIEFYCAVGQYMDPVKAIKLINEFKAASEEMNVELSDVKDACRTPEKLNDLLSESSATEETKQAFKESYLAVKDLFNEIETNHGLIVEAPGQGKTDMAVQSPVNFSCFFSDVELI